MVHVNEIAAAAQCVLEADSDRVRGQTFNCTSGLISQHQVAQLAKQISGSSCEIHGSAPSGGRIMETGKLESLGYEFATVPHLQATLSQMIDHLTA